MSTCAQVRGPQATPNPRLCVPTLRSVWREAFQCSLYEAQDVLAETSDADLVELQAGSAFHIADRWQRRLVYRRLSPSLASAGLKRCRPPSRDYDLFVAVCNNAWDLLYINTLRQWRERSK